MAISCPACGSEVDYVDRPARVLAGTCGACGRALTIVQEGPAGVERGDATTPSEGEEPSTTVETGRSTHPGPVCRACGAPLTFQPSAGSSIEAVCSGCGSRETYLLATATGNRPRAPPEGRGRPWDSRAPDFAGSRTRPCRQCGAPLRFSTGAEGTVTGECDSCGNRFTLPPRQDRGGGRGGRDGSRRYGVGSSSRYRGRGAGSGGGEGRPRRFGPPSGRFRRREPEGEGGGDDGTERKRRRPRT